MKSNLALDWIPILSSVTSAKIFLVRGTFAALCLLALAHPLLASTQVWQWIIPQRYEAARPFDATGLCVKEFWKFRSHFCFEFDRNLGDRARVVGRSDMGLG